MNKYKIVLLASALCMIAFFATSCEKKTPANSQINTEIPEERVQADDDTVEELLVSEEERDYYKKYFTDDFSKNRIDNISDWKDKEGNWCYPAGYKITWIPSDDETMAAQQFPEELLADMSTDELYQFIMKAHGQWAQSAFDTYVSSLSSYYSRYNFIAELMQREDCAEVVHKYYSKITDDDVKRYSKMSLISYSDTSKTEKQELFQLMEGMEWFFLYKDGKSVPDDRVFGLNQLQTDK